ncbi:hypothetical protein D3C77_776850 [compost metagenome]
MKELGGGRLHDRCRDGGSRRFADDGGELGNAFPVAVIIEEAAGLAGSDYVGSVRTGFTLIALDAFSDQPDPVLERST